MKYIFTLFICLGFLSMSSSFGQETKKVIVVKKVLDENGQTVTKREEASGADAEAIIKKLKEDGSLDGIDIDVEIEKAKKTGSSSNSTSEDISIEKSMEDGKEITTYKIVTEENGEKKVMIWKGEAGDEMPDDMAKKLKDIDIKTKKSQDGKEIMISIDAEDHEDGEIHETHTVEKRIVVKRSSENKVSLGVMIEDDSQGVVINDIVEDSAAQKAGLQSGDTILKINGNYIFSTEMLLKELSQFDKGDKIKLTYLRDGKEQKTEAEF